MSLESMKSRLTAIGKTPEERLIRGKLNTLKKALIHSYQAETISLEGVEYRALLNSNKLKMDYDDKIISIPFESNIKVGDLFYWGRTEEYWIVYLRQFSEDAYFRGYVRKAQHILKWKNKYGKELQTYVAVRGPVETKVKTEQKSGLSYDVPNYTLSIIAPNNECTVDLRRYSKVELDGEEWEVTVADRVSEVGVIDLQLVERLNNKDLNNLKPVIEVKTNLDNVGCIEIDKPVYIDYEVYVDGVKDESLKQKVSISVEGETALLRNNNLLLRAEEVAILSITVGQTDYKRELSICGTSASPIVREVLAIDGNEVVKAYGTTIYTATLLENGKILPPNGTWTVSGDKIYTIKEQTSTTLTLGWKSGLVGNIIISYNQEGVEEATKKVRTTSLL